MFSRLPSNINTPTASNLQHQNLQHHNHQYDLHNADATSTTNSTSTMSAPPSSTTPKTTTQSTTTTNATITATRTAATAAAIASSLHVPRIVSAATTAATFGDIQAAALTVDDEEFNRLSGDPNWWLSADGFESPLPFDASESGLWNGRFVPPPPRPPFLDESTATDGLTTCDLCTWAWHDRNAFSLDASIGG